MSSRDHPSTSTNFPCGRESYRELSEPLGKLSSSLSFLYVRETFHYYSSTFRFAGRPSVKFCQLSVPAGTLPPSSVNFPYSRETYSTSVHLLSGLEAFRQVPSTLRAARRPSVNIRAIFKWPVDHFDGRSSGRTES